MKLDLEGIDQSKRDFRKQLAARPIVDKLRMLDALRERTLTIKRAPKNSPAKSRPDLRH